MGERLHDWANFELADLEADGHVDGATETWASRLLIRRHVAGDALAFFTTWVARPARPSKPWSGWKGIAGSCAKVQSSRLAGDATPLSNPGGKPLDDEVHERPHPRRRCRAADEQRVERLAVLRVERLQ